MELPGFAILEGSKNRPDGMPEFFCGISWIAFTISKYFVYWILIGGDNNQDSNLYTR